MMSYICGRPHGLGRMGSRDLLDSIAEAGDQVPFGMDAEPPVRAGGSWHKLMQQTPRSLDPSLRRPMNGHEVMTELSCPCISLSLSFLCCRRGCFYSEDWQRCR